ncbi:MAG: discoidin domain-containing protein [Alphaproteobacteria bacterium]|nr:discoidin domain-containing protein [Alphaproteobacteria bacterium]
MAAFRFWRIYVTAVDGEHFNYGFSPAFEIGEIELTISGVDQTVVGGNASASSLMTLSGAEARGIAANAIDNDVWEFGFWAETIASAPLPQWWAYDFGVGNEKELTGFTLAPSTYTGLMPKNFTIQASNDGITWIDGDTFTDVTFPTNRVSISFSLSVVDNAVPPSITSNGGGLSASISYAENSAAVVTVVTVNDPDSAVVVLSMAGDDADSFNFNGSTGDLSFIAPPDFENPTDLNEDNIYHVTITADDQSGGIDTQDISITVTDVGAGSGGETHSASKWQAVVTVDGIDMSDKVTGRITVEAEESTSRIANFKIYPNAGAISTRDFFGVPVTINYKTATAEDCIFTGLVDKALNDPSTGLISFECTDDMQVKIEALSQDEIDSLIMGSRWSNAVFGDYKDGWLYLENLLDTHPQAFDYNADGVTGTLVDWAAKLEADFSYDSDSIVSSSINYQMMPRRNLSNEFVIDYQYRFNRLKHREHDFAWPGVGFCTYAAQAHKLPDKNMIYAAASSAGWLVQPPLTYTNPPASGYEICGIGTGVWVINEKVRKLLVLSASWTAIKRWTQTATEVYTITVKAPQSIDWVGVNSVAERASNATDIDATGWTDGYDTPSGRTDSINDIVQDGFDRDVSDNDMETLIARARTEILSSHRSNYVSADVELAPQIERFHTVRLSANGITGQGKVFQFMHSLNVDTAEALTTIRIAISVNGGGDADGDTVISAPAAPDTDPLISAPDDSTILATRIGNDDSVDDYDALWEGFTSDYSYTVGTPSANQKYPRRFQVKTPNINQEAIDAIEAKSVSEFSFDIPNEILTVTAI